MKRTVQKEYVALEQDESNIAKSNLIIFTYSVSKTGQVKVLDYFDSSTGEIIPKDKAKVKTIRSNNMLERFARLDSLKEEVRKFAIFLLRFRNQACGFLVPVEKIIEYYSIYTKKDKKNIRRYLPILINNNILQDEFTLEKIFMVNNPERTSSDAKGDMQRAGIIFDTLFIRSSERNAHMENT